MNSAVVTREELQRVHRALRITTPLDQLSPLMLTTLTVVAHNWRRNGAPKCAQQTKRVVRHVSHRQAQLQPQPQIDLKRRAAGDLD